MSSRSSSSGSGSGSRRSSGSGSRRRSSSSGSRRRSSSGSRRRSERKSSSSMNNSSGKTRKISSAFKKIKHSELRQKFYDTLEGDLHAQFITNIFEIALQVEQKICGVELEYDTYKLTFLPSKNGHCMEIFGGSVFFTLFLEARKLGLIDESDLVFLKNFLEYKTIDVDASLHYEIKPDLTEESIEIVKPILDSFNKQYHELMNEIIELIMRENPKLLEFFTFLAKEKGFKGFDFLKNGKIIPYIGPEGIFSLNISVNYDGVFEMRPQLNTCIETDKYCDHILEILTRNDSKLTSVELYNFTSVRPYLGRNILLLCVQNFDRLYRSAEEFIKGPVTEKKALLTLTNFFKQNPDFKTKYMQGFYRIQLVHVILIKLLSIGSSSKFNNLKKIFTVDFDTKTSISSPITSNRILISLLPKKRRTFNYQYFNGLKYLTNKEFTLEKIAEIIGNLIDTWLIIHKKIVKNFSKSSVLLIDYMKPPGYLVNNDSLDYKQIGLELNINFEEDWESTVSNEKIIQILNKLNLKIRPVNASSRNFLIKDIKKKLKLTE